MRVDRCSEQYWACLAPSEPYMIGVHRFRVRVSVSVEFVSSGVCREFKTDIACALQTIDKRVPGTPTHAPRCTRAHAAERCTAELALSGRTSLVGTRQSRHETSALYSFY